MRRPRWFLKHPHSCNYCQAVNGVTFTVPPKVTARIVWVACGCGRRHYICHACLSRVGATRNGALTIRECAKGYKVESAADGGGKGA